MRVSPAAARFDPLISTQVFGAMVALSPSALAILEISGTVCAAVMKLRDMNLQFPVSQPRPTVYDLILKSCPCARTAKAAARKTCFMALPIGLHSHLGI